MTHGGHATKASLCAHILDTHSNLCYNAHIGGAAMKKTYYQFGPMLLPYNLLRLAFAALGIFMIVYGLAVPSKDSLLAIVTGAPIALFCGFSYFADMCNRIILTDTKMLITGQPLPAYFKRQYRDEVLYSDIANVTIIQSTKVSKKKRVPNDHGGRYIGTIYTYYQIELKNGRKKWFGITFFSKRQRMEMLSIINQKTGLASSYEALLEQMDHRLK